MCGIAGWQLPPGRSRNLGDLEAMSQAIVHRGPDDHGIFADPAHGVALAHRRLSIIDLSAGGHQPMSCDDGKVVLVFNGELYNYIDLKRELEAEGRIFHSRSDTEVALVALSHWGTSALGRFDGMFALAAWFSDKRMLLLARDPLGMKPLYYTVERASGGLLFASEIKAFLSLKDFVAVPNLDSVNQYLEFGYIFSESETALTGISKLPPGHAMEISDGRETATYAYFAPAMADPADARLPSEIADALHDRLATVVQQHLVADVPVGLLLSGGLDSSIIAALAARNSQVETITMGFANSNVDERAYARRVAGHIGSEHREILIDQAEIVDGLENAAWYFDDLFADWGTVSTRILYCKCREQGIKVVLVGEGSDELFGGYPVFPAAANGRGPLAWQLFRLYRMYSGRRYGGQFGRFSKIMRGYLARCGGSMFGAVRLFETRNQLPNNYVMKVDKASMSVSVEARAPFLDRRVAELAYSINPGHLLAGGTNKFVLRDMAERHNLLPQEITRRPKFGGSIAATWMDDSPEFRSYAAAAILSKEGWTDRLGMRHVMSEFFAGRSTGYAFPRALSLFSNLAWRLLLLNLWSRKYLSS